VEIEEAVAMEEDDLSVEEDDEDDDDHEEVLANFLLRDLDAVVWFEAFYIILQNARPLRGCWP
jgi:hypothetical protein